MKNWLLYRVVVLLVFVGVEDENLVTRRDTIRLHIQNLMEDMYREEEVLKAKMIESVAHSTKELAELCTQLSVPFDAVSVLMSRDQGCIEKTACDLLAFSEPTAGR